MQSMPASDSAWQCVSTETFATTEVQMDPIRSAYKKMLVIVSIVWWLAVWKSKWMILLCHYYEKSLIFQRHTCNITAQAMNKKEIVCFINYSHFERFIRFFVAPRRLLTPTLEFRTLYTLLLTSSTPFMQAISPKNISGHLPHSQQ